MSRRIHAIPLPGRSRTSFPRLSAPILLLLSLFVHHAHAAPASFLDQMRAKRLGKPNIIFILADDLGYGDLGCYGQQRIRTPNLDRLAGEGVRFTQCYAGSTVCAPSRAVLLTGLHTGHARIRGNKEVPLASSDVTVAELLQNAGYRTGAIGKWGLGNENSTGRPDLHGFDQWLGYLDQTHAHDYFPVHLWRSEGSEIRKVELGMNLAGQHGKYSHDLFTQAATNFITATKETPFFLYLAYTIPHANNELARLTGNGMEVPDDQPYAGENWPAPEKNKAAMITRLDADVGRILGLLDALDLATNTIVFFSSDNGPHKEGGVDPAFFNSSGSLRGIKRDLYEGGIRVPMIVRWKGHAPAGKVSGQVWSFADFIPTATAIAKTGLPRGLDGTSILPAILGEPVTPRPDPLYWEFHEQGFHQAVRLGDWKAVRHGPASAVELYDLAKDPSEKNDVAARNPEVIAQIQDFLKAARTESNDWPVTAAQPSEK